MGSAPDDTAVRSTLGSYRLLGEVGRDPLGVLYLACPAGARTFPKWAVVRRMHGGVARDPVMVHAFVAATQAALRMVHRNIATTFDFGGKMTLPWSAREHLFGVTMLDLVVRLTAQRTKVPWPLACYLVAEAAEGVAAVRARLPAHGPPMGFLTGAVTPSIFVTQAGDVKIVDGCLPLIDGVPLIDSQALPYRRHEPASLGPNAGRSDVFGLGVVLWELVAGRRLFAGRTDEETHRLLDAQVIPALRTSARASSLIDEVVQRAVGDAPPTLAFASAAELAAELRAGLDSERQRPGPQDVARAITELFAAELGEQRATVVEAWAEEQALQQLGELASDASRDGDLTLPNVFETVRDTTTETTISRRGGPRVVDGFDDVPTIPRDRSVSVSSWRPQTPLQPSRPVPPPRIDYLPGEPSPPPSGQYVASSVPVPLPVPPPRRRPPPRDEPEIEPEIEAESEVDRDDEAHAPQEPAPGPPPWVGRPARRTERDKSDSLVLPLVERPLVFPHSQPVAPMPPTVRTPHQAPPVPPRRSVLLATGAVGFVVAFIAIIMIGLSRRGASDDDFTPAPRASAPATAAPAPSAPRPSPRPPDPWTPLPQGTIPVTSLDDLPRAAGSASAQPVAPRPRPPPPPPAAPTGRAGLLTVFCTPACDQVLDGSRSLGPSPVFKLPTSIGVHRLRLRAEGGAVEKTVTVTVKENDTTVVRESLDP